MITKLYNPIQQALELQLEILRRTENICDDDDDCLVCVVCYQDENDCQCNIDERLMWPIIHVVRMLESVVKDMSN